MKSFLLRFVLLFAIVAGFAMQARAQLVYNTRFGHFVMETPGTLWLRVDTKSPVDRTSTLSYIAFSAGGSKSGTVNFVPGQPVDVGHFTEMTSITFWFSSLDPLGLPPSNLAVTNKIQVQEQGDKVLYRMENRMLKSAILFTLFDEPDGTDKRVNVEKDERPVKNQAQSQTPLTL